MGRPKATGLLAHQFFVYEAFQRMPRQAHFPQQSAHQAANQQASSAHMQQQQKQNQQQNVSRVPEAASNQAQLSGYSSRFRSGAGTLSAIAQQAAAERPSISIAELMDAYRSATAKLDAEFASLTAKMPNAAVDINFVQLRNHPISVHVG